jgi:hypothetical protein
MAIRVMLRVLKHSMLWIWNWIETIVANYGLKKCMTMGELALVRQATFWQALRWMG